MLGVEVLNTSRAVKGATRSDHNPRPRTETHAQVKPTSEDHGFKFDPRSKMHGVFALTLQ